MSKYQDKIISVFKSNKYSNFQPLEVVGRGSETQIQVTEIVYKLPGYE